MLNPLPANLRASLTVAALSFTLGSACATDSKVTADDAFATRKTSSSSASGGGAAVDPAAADALVNAGVSPEKFARSFKRPVECEAAARGAKANPDRAWQYLRACIGRGGFTLLTPLLENWIGDLRSRPEAPGVLAEIIAARGGHVKTDLQQVQQRRLPIFDLASALAQPGTYKGRYVVFVAKVSAIKPTSKGKTEVALSELAIGAEAMDRNVGTRHVSSYSGAGSASYKSSSGSASASGSYSSGYSSGAVETTYQEAFDETGQEVLAKLVKADPFLTIDRQFVFLAKFDGAKESDVTPDDDSVSEAPAKVALVSLVSYHDMHSNYTW